MTVGLTDASGFQRLLESRLSHFYRQGEWKDEELNFVVIAGCRWLCCIVQEQKYLPSYTFSASKSKMIENIHTAFDIALQCKTQIHRLLCYRTDIHPWASRIGNDNVADADFWSACCAFLHSIETCILKGDFGRPGPLDILA